jgi:HAE1 family hydrophobic/amphiphilic exporter-1
MSIAILVSLFVSFSLTPMLSSRWLVAREHGAHKAVPRAGRRPVLPADRARVPRDARGSACGGGSSRRAGVRTHAAVAAGRLGYFAKKSVPPVDDQAQFEVVAARAGGHGASSPPASSRSGSRARSGAVRRRGGGHADHRWGRRPAPTTTSPRSTSACRTPASATSPRTSSRTSSAGTSSPTCPSDLFATVGDVSAVRGLGARTPTVQYNLVGPDLDKLTERCRTRPRSGCAKVPGAVDVDSTLVVGKPELGAYDRPRPRVAARHHGHRRRPRRCR